MVVCALRCPHTMAAQAPAFAILQPIAGDRPAYPVRKLSVSLGKGDKRGVGTRNRPSAPITTG